MRIACVVLLVLALAQNLMYASDNENHSDASGPWIEMERRFNGIAKHFSDRLHLHTGDTASLKRRTSMSAALEGPEEGIVTVLPVGTMIKVLDTLSETEDGVQLDFWYFIEAWSNGNGLIGTGWIYFMLLERPPLPEWSRKDICLRVQRVLSNARQEAKRLYPTELPLAEFNLQQMATLTLTGDVSLYARVSDDSVMLVLPAGTKVTNYNPKTDGDPPHYFVQADLLGTQYADGVRQGAEDGWRFGYKHRKDSLLAEPLLESLWTKDIDGGQGAPYITGYRKAWLKAYREGRMSREKRGYYRITSWSGVYHENGVIYAEDLVGLCGLTPVLQPDSAVNCDKQKAHVDSVVNDLFDKFEREKLIVRDEIDSIIVEGHVRGWSSTASRQQEVRKVLPESEPVVSIEQPKPTLRGLAIGRTSLVSMLDSVGFSFDCVAGVPIDGLPNYVGQTGLNTLQLIDPKKNLVTVSASVIVDRNQPQASGTAVLLLPVTAAIIDQNSVGWVTDEGTRLLEVPHDDSASTTLDGRLYRLTWQNNGFFRALWLTIETPE